MKIYLCPYENRGLKLPVNISTKSPFRISLASILRLCPALFSALVTETHYGTATYCDGEGREREL
jgi:hypothetical protein